MRNLSLKVTFLLSIISFGLAGENGETMEVVKDLDLDRFMGDWHVIANIPTFIEKNTSNNLESYRLREDGNVDITFSVTTDKLKRKAYHAKGFVLDPAQPSRWKVQFFWPIKFPFYVLELGTDYEYTVIGLPSKKYLWIMARVPSMDIQLYNSILARLTEIGYNINDIKKVPFNTD